MRADFATRDLKWDVMQVDDVDQVLALEQAVYPHPWSRANFLDSLFNHYEAWVLRDTQQYIIGYVLVLLAVNEAHLLNIAVSKDVQGQGIGRLLLDKAVSLSRGANMEMMVLEVRPSNTRALAIYQRYGFIQTRRRKAYYPACDGQREDALEMILTL